MISTCLGKAGCMIPLSRAPSRQIVESVRSSACLSLPEAFSGQDWINDPGVPDMEECSIPGRAGNFPDRPRSSGKLYRCRGSSVVRRVRRGDPRAHAGRVESGDFTLAARFLAHFTETVSQNREPAAGMSGELRQTSRFLHNLRRTCCVMGRIVITSRKFCAAQNPGRI